MSVAAPHQTVAADPLTTSETASAGRPLPTAQRLQSAVPRGMQRYLALDDFDGTDEFEEVDEFEDEWDEDVGVEADWDVEVDGYCEAGDCGEEFLDDAV